MKNKLIATSLKEIQAHLKQCRWGIRSYSGDIERLLKKSPRADEVKRWGKDISDASKGLGRYQGEKMILEKLVGDTERFLSVQLFSHYEKPEKNK